MKSIVLALLSIVLTACTSTNFVKTGFDQVPAHTLTPCNAVVLQHTPENRKFVELGFCTTSLPGGGVIKDKTPEAVKELQSCACQNGGNAIVYQGEEESGLHTGFGYSQQHIKARATVLFVYPDEKP